MGMFFGAAICVVILFFSVVMLRDSNRFVTVSYSQKARGIKKRIRIVLLSDLHNKQYGKDNEKLLAAIDSAAPDLIVSAGDMMTSVKGKSTEPASRLIGQLAKKYPFYYGNGNHEGRIYHDRKAYGDMGKQYRRALEKSRVCLLENAVVQLPNYGICIVGLDLHREHYQKFREGMLPLSELKGLVGECRGDCYTILIAHNPAFFDTYAAWGADLTVSGHVHGGVMRLPKLGGVLSTSLRLFPKYDGGKFEKDGKVMIVSRGLGSHTVPVRIWNPAELVVIDLEPTGR